MPHPAPTGTLAVDGPAQACRRRRPRPQLRPGDTVDLADVGGPTVGDPRAAERRAGMPDAHAEGLGKVQHR
jgi:hypothetical protein